MRCMPKLRMIALGLTLLPLMSACSESGGSSTDRGGSQAANGAASYEKYCADCHADPNMRAPSRQMLEQLSEDAIFESIQHGRMQSTASALSTADRKALASYLSRNSLANTDWVSQNRCDKKTAAPMPIYASGWGIGEHNQRYVPPGLTSVDRTNAKDLEAAWSLVMPQVTEMRSQPVVLGDTLYLGDKTGVLYALDRSTGCVRRHKQLDSGIYTAITLVRSAEGRDTLVFGDTLANVIAVDAMTFDVLWKKSARIFESSLIGGSITHSFGRLFVPVASNEGLLAASNDFECCHAHGAVLALDIDDGGELWRWESTFNSKEQGKNLSGQALYGPSGASVWVTPVVDQERGLVYVATGENTSIPASEYSDAIVALEVDSGRVMWSYQATEGDIWNAACLNNGANCADASGPGEGFNASLIVAKMPDGRELLLAGQKSGEVLAFDLDAKNAKDRLLWRKNVGQGSIYWGMAVSQGKLLIGIAEHEEGHGQANGLSRPGLLALNLKGGKELWRVDVSDQCEPSPTQAADATPSCSSYFGLSGALLTTDELVFAGALDGTVRAWDVDTGKLLWQQNTAEPVTGNNGLSGHGGSIDVGGQVLAGDWLYVSSGVNLYGRMPGNVLRAYRIPGLGW